MECPKCEREIKEEEKECPYCHYDLVNKPEIEKEGMENYKKWCLGGLITIVVIVIIGLSITSSNKNTVTSSNTTNNTYIGSTKDNYNNNKKIKKNPYEIMNNYDGIYKFVLNSDNGSGRIFTSIGVISFNSGECKIKYEYTPNGGKTSTREYEGFCGLNKEDNSTFYFILNDDDNYEVKTYKGIQNEAGFLCELKSEFDLSGCTNKELKLEKLENVTSINTAFSEVLKMEKERKEAEEKAKKEQEEKEFKESCKTYTFEQMARNPDNFKGTNVKLTGEVVQVMEGLASNSLRVNITKKGTYSTYYTDTIYVNYIPEKGEDKILENDIVTIYGTSQGDYSYTSTLGATITLPFVDGKYITIEK